jgi:adenylylsulfate kinase-like enzyme
MRDGTAVIVWLNGPFGVGKTTTARALVDVLPGSRLLDPEHVGLLLRDTLNEPVGDFQDRPPRGRGRAADRRLGEMIQGAQLPAPGAVARRARPTGGER